MGTALGRQRGSCWQGPGCILGTKPQGDAHLPHCSLGCPVPRALPVCIPLGPCGTRDSEKRTAAEQSSSRAAVSHASKSLSALGRSVLLGFPRTPSVLEDGNCNPPTAVLPRFSLGKYSRCLSPNSGHPWGLSADKPLHTSKKAGRGENVGQSSGPQPRGTPPPGDNWQCLDTWRRAPGGVQGGGQSPCNAHDSLTPHNSTAQNFSAGVPSPGSGCFRSPWHSPGSPPAYTYTHTHTHTYAHTSGAHTIHCQHNGLNSTLLHLTLRVPCLVTDGFLRVVLYFSL